MMNSRDNLMSYGAWEMSVPDSITGDSRWKMEAYRLALFACEIGWRDVTKLMRDRRTVRLSDQLYRALGSISANLAEGYSRGTGRDRARFYECALGSAREARGWYYQGRYILSETVFTHRAQLLTEIIRLLLTTVPAARGRKLAEPSAPYEAALSSLLTDDLPMP